MIDRRTFIGGCVAGAVGAGLPKEPSGSDLLDAYRSLPKRRRYSWLTHCSFGGEAWRLTKPMRVYFDEPIDKAEGERLLREMGRLAERNSRIRQPQSLWASHGRIVG